MESRIIQKEMEKNSQQVLIGITRPLNVAGETEEHVPNHLSQQRKRGGERGGRESEEREGAKK